MAYSGYANAPSPTPPTPSLSPSLGSSQFSLGFNNPPPYRPGQKLTTSPHMMVNNMQQMSMGGGAQLGGSNMATPHIQRQLDQAAVSRQSASPHHHARMMRSTTATSKDGEGLAGANGREPSRDPPNGTTVERQWTTLDVGGMAIRNISKELFRYTFLTTLYLNHNQITVIPPQIANLKNLVRLDASGNRLMSVPPELGLLSLLKELLLFDNQLTTLPPELGFLYQLDNLGLEGNPIQEPLLSLLQKDGTTGVISYLRDSCPVPPNPPDREWIYLENDIPSQEADSFTVLSYNVLCEKYAPASSYQYCPSWALDWNYRKDNILNEITGYNTDIVCLQEIEMGQFEEFFQPQFRNADYDGIFFPKSRARTMSEVEKRGVDGCATFWKSNKFSLVEKHLIEFQRIPMERPEFRKSDDMFNRVTLRDNIAVITYLENKETKSRVLIANAHLHWDPSFRDVKLVQTSMLTDELQRVISVYANLPPRHPIHAYYQQNPSRLPLLVVGDFNSMPDSGVYEFMTRGTVTKDHEDFLNHSYYNSDSNVTHKLQLKSSYANIGELNFTNYTPTFKGTIDYIWYSTQGISVTGLLGNLDPAYMTKQVGFPNWHHPSDHIPIMVEVRLRGPNAGGAAGTGSASFGNSGGRRGFGLGGARK